MSIRVPSALRLARGSGTVLSADKAARDPVRTGQGILAVERLQLQFKKPLDWRVVSLNGKPGTVRGIRLGEREPEGI